MIPFPPLPVTSFLNNPLLFSKIWWLEVPVFLPFLIYYHKFSLGTKRTWETRSRIRQRNCGWWRRFLIGQSTNDLYNILCEHFPVIMDNYFELNPRIAKLLCLTLILNLFYEFLRYHVLFFRLSYRRLLTTFEIPMNDQQKKCFIVYFLTIITFRSLFLLQLDASFLWKRMIYRA